MLNGVNLTFVAFSRMMPESPVWQVRKGREEEAERTMLYLRGRRYPGTAAELEEIGFAIAAYPLACLSSAMRAMLRTLSLLRAGEDHTEGLLPFDELRSRVGFDAYYEAEQRYRR